MGQLHAGEGAGARGGLPGGLVDHEEAYEQGESGVIRAYAEAIGSNGMSSQQKQMHQYFSFRLAAARSIYAARFLAEHDAERAELKERIASLFGQAHLHTLTEDNEALADTLEGIAELDDRFRELCILRG